MSFFSLLPFHVDLSIIVGSSVISTRPDWTSGVHNYALLGCFGCCVVSVFASMGSMRGYFDGIYAWYSMDMRNCILFDMMSSYRCVQLVVSLV